MSVPQVKDRPTSALRAVFAGIGSLLSGNKSGKGKSDDKDKLRAKPAAEAPANAQAPAPTADAPETAAAPETPVAAEAVAAEPEAVTPAPAAEPAKAAEPEAVAAEAVAKSESPAELPLANYEELTVASLRARLRNLSNDDLVVLKEYEQGHQNRPEVVKMFQNRLIKMTSSLPKLEA